MLNSEYEVLAITPALGAEINGLDIASPIPPDTLQALRGTWLERKVLCFRDQTLSPLQQLAFSRQFGEIDKYPFLRGIEGYPEVAPVLKLPEEKVNFGGVWHSDTAYLEAPAAGASLYALDVPAVGGDTLFCNTALAYEKLPAELKERLRGLTAINTSSKNAVSKTRIPSIDRERSTPREFEYEHPVIRIHPETKQRTLYVNEAHTLRFRGWTDQNSIPLLEKLFRHLRRPEFQCRIRWRPGTLVLWDNRSTQHYPINDYHGYRRLLHRVSIKGDRPQGLPSSGL